jgi:hypothetical protein
MSFMKPTKKFFAAGLAALALSMMAADSIAAQAPVTGAIFTTLADGTYVNANIYNDRKEVYLNGGPRPNAPCTAAGLPDGQYYFQVTDPSGKVLLSTDPIEDRNVQVLAGVIVGPEPYTHVTHVMLDTGECGGWTVQLWPFDPTPNPGGEYKVWMTRKDDYDLFGFIPEKSKTDNFKVIGPLDSDGDGVPDDEDTTCPDNQLEC